MPKSVAEVRADLTAPGQLFEMDEVDIRGIPTRVWKNAPGTLRDVVALSALQGDKTFIACDTGAGTTERMTFTEHSRAAATFAQRLIERGVEKGDRVAIAMRNFPEWVVAFWGTAAAGAVAVPLNAWWTGSELTYGLNDSGARILVADEQRAASLRDHAPELSLNSVVVVRADHATGEREEPWGDFLGTIENDLALPNVAIEPDDDATIFYTSGTTGLPKGVLGTHRNICTSLISAAFVYTYAMARKEGEIPDLMAMASSGMEMATLLTVPLFHVTGCHAVMLSSIGFGTKLVMMFKWDPERALQLIESEKVTTFVGVPSMAWQLLDSPNREDHDLSSLQSLAYGGAAAPPELARRIDKMFPGRTPSNGWGMTETSSTCTGNVGADYLAKPDSVGPVLPVCNARIVADDSSDVPTGETGELLVKGPNVVKGYWNNPAATADTFQDGWLRTGDIARIDEEGFIYLVDRAKDMVIRAGENISSAEVEAAIFEHPAVADCAVIGVPHQVLGEEVGAVVVTKPGASVNEHELATHCRERLAGFKQPTHWWVQTAELPRNPAGKVVKRELKEEVLGRERGGVRSSPAAAS